MNARLVNESEIETKITGEQNQEVELGNGDNAIIIRKINEYYLVGIKEY